MKTKLLVIIIPAIFIVGCSKNGLEGTYKCNGGAKLEFEFKDGSSGYVGSSGQKATFEYEIEGSNLVMTAGDGKTMVLTIEGGVLKGDTSAIGTCEKM